MPKRATSSAYPPFTLDTSSTLPLYKQLYDRLRDAILEGQLERGVRLPSTRTLASEIGVSRATTTLAYEQLLSEGFLESRVGQGTTVACALPIALVAEHIERTRHRQHDTPQPVLAARVAQLSAIPRTDNEHTGTDGLFRACRPALDLFPSELWARLLARRARRSVREFANYQSFAGHDDLREAIAAHIAITRGVRCLPDQVIVTNGTQGAVDLIARTLIDPGDAAWLEDPGYLGARGALIAAGARVVPVPVDAEGLDVEAGARRGPDARLLCVTPSHQFPTGATMSLGRRLALLEWARQSDAWIVEDDYDGEFRFSGRPLEALHSLDQAGRVIYVGSFSKVLFPSLRLGYLVAPPELVAPLLAVRRFIDVHTPILEQMALADFMREGHFARHLRQMLSHYRQRRDVLQCELSTHLAHLLDVHTPDVGMHVVGWLPPDKDDRRASALAARVGVDVTPISLYCLEPKERGGLHFGFTGVEEHEIRQGVRRLATALEAL